MVQMSRQERQRMPAPSARKAGLPMAKALFQRQGLVREERGALRGLTLLSGCRDGTAVPGVSSGGVSEWPEAVGDVCAALPLRVAKTTLRCVAGKLLCPLFYRLLKNVRVPRVDVCLIFEIAEFYCAISGDGGRGGITANISVLIVGIYENSSHIGSIL